VLTVRHAVCWRTGSDVGACGSGIGGGRKKRRRADGRDAAVVVGYGGEEQARGTRHGRCRRCCERLARPALATRGVPGTYASPVGPPPVHTNAAAARTPGTATAPTEPTSPALDASQLTEMPAPLPTSPEEHDRRACVGRGGREHAACGHDTDARRDESPCRRGRRPAGPREWLARGPPTCALWRRGHGVRARWRVGQGRG
jgi:hypothetical protein